MNQDCSIELNVSTSNPKKPFLVNNLSSFALQTPRLQQEDLNNPSFPMKDRQECKPCLFKILSYTCIANSLNNLEDGLYTVIEDPLMPSSVSLNDLPESEVFDSNIRSEIRLNINSPLAIAGRQIDVVQVPYSIQQDTTAPTTTQNRGWSIQEEAKNVLQKISELYIFIMGAYILSILIIQGFLSCYCLFAFIIAICAGQAVRSLKHSNEELFMTDRQKRVKYFKALDWTLVGGFLLVSALRMELISVDLTPFVVPGFVSAIMFYLFCDVHNSFMRTRTITLYKLLFWGQVLLISMKVDGSIDNWAFVFVALFYTFVFFMSVSVGFFILAFSYVCQNCHMDGFDFNIVGLLWDFLNALFSWVWGFSLLGLIEELKNQDGASILLPGLICGVVHCSLLMLFTKFLRNSLLSYLVATLQLIINVEETPVTNQSFETIKGTIPYLLKISPTYFMVMNDNLSVKDKARAEGCKKQIKEVKKQRKQMKPVPKRIKVQAGVKKDVPEYKSATIRLESKTLKGVKSGANGGLVADNTPGIRDVQLTNLCYSDDDAQVLDQVQQRAQKEHNNNEENEQTCMICCINAPNAVFMRCGHGGVCYSCALETWKKGDKCALCRQPIDEILRVTLVNGVNVAKVIEGTKKYPTINSLEELPE